MFGGDINRYCCVPISDAKLLISIMRVHVSIGDLVGVVVNKVETTVRLSLATLRAFSCSVSAWNKMLFYANKAVSINEADFWEKSYLLRQKLLGKGTATINCKRHWVVVQNS
ncbi:hypothetical protein RHMOL_Rhmol02G0164700 [Rhododendron molle]|uniref:Uncharacterized protein n=1 Tax=Rhododendron molle TaxID=49168 RepID=A0ACC0PS90_RHOML|nr:hypothetical protein RHMOL_Rhmol02G0164700 [Rhododendron molle]